ncbi:MAG: CinA family protein [Candidatus Omnitrophota bacterium]
MTKIARQIHKILIKRGKTVPVAESCTGGLLSKLLTDLPGSSKYFVLGVVAYNNKIKESILNIPAKIIRKNGAVSTEVAVRMAKSVREIAKTDFGVSITGIAGPSGGTKQKPVGTVFIAVADNNNVISKKFKLSGLRNVIRAKSALQALKLLNTLI